MKISAAISFEDWTDIYGTWGKVGVYRILRYLRDSGVDRVYWRSMGGGVVAYPSRLEDSIRTAWVSPKAERSGFKVNVMRSKEYEEVHLLNGNIKESEIVDIIFDMGEFDSIACARKVSKILGLEFFLWHEAHQECHGPHEFSNFVRENPHLCPINCYGERLPGHLSWGYPETIERRMDILKEVMAYKPDGIMLDFVKGGDHMFPRIDGKGYSAIGYEKPILNAFKEKTGKDAKTLTNDDMEWIKFRASYVTEFVKKAREYQKKWYPEMKLGSFGVHKGRPMGAYQDETESNSIVDKKGIMGATHGKYNKRKIVTTGMVGPLEGNLEDHETWTKEGLVDSLVADISPLLTLSDGNLNSEEYGKRIDYSRSLLKGDCSFGTQLNTWAANKAQILDAARVANEHGCKEVVLWEFIGVIRKNTLDAIKEISGKYKENMCQK